MSTSKKVTKGNNKKSSNVKTKTVDPLPSVNDKKAIKKAAKKSAPKKLSKKKEDELTQQQAAEANADQTPIDHVEAQTQEEEKGQESVLPGHSLPENQDEVIEETLNDSETISFTGPAENRGESQLPSTSEAKTVDDQTEEYETDINTHTELEKSQEAAWNFHKGQREQLKENADKELYGEDPRVNDAGLIVA